MAGSGKSKSFKSIFEVRKLLRGEGCFNQWPKRLGKMEFSTEVEPMSSSLLLQTLHTADLQETMPVVGAKALN